jgi:hypothetical protein
MKVKTRLSIVGVFVSVITALLSVMLSAESNTKMALVLTLYFSGMAGGASIVSLFCRLKYGKSEEKD